MLRHPSKDSNGGEVEAMAGKGSKKSTGKTTKKK